MVTLVTLACILSQLCKYLQYVMQDSTNEMYQNKRFLKGQKNVFALTIKETSAADFKRLMTLFSTGPLRVVIRQLPG